jgi:copper chaperone CopZ
MELTLLSVADCPNAALLVERLTALGVEPETVTRTVVSDEAQAVAAGMHGSPTLLVDGRDPFAAADAPRALACRLYRGADGGVQGAPSLEDLRAVLSERARIVLSVPEMNCGTCQRAIQDALGAVAGIESVEADVPGRVVTVSYRAPASDEAITAAIQDAGYQVADAGSRA